MEIWKKMWVGVFFLNTVYISCMLHKTKDFSLDLYVPSELLWVTILAEIQWPMQNSRMHAWQMLYWRTVQRIEWSLPSVRTSVTPDVTTQISIWTTSMWSRSCMPVPPTCTWFDVEPAASTASVVVAWCVIALTPEERSVLHCSEHTVASGYCRGECRVARRCSSRAFTV